MLKGIERYCMTLPGATKNIQWEKDLVFKVGGKMFCCMGIEKTSKFSFKVENERFLEMTDQPGIIPAPYLARAKWVQVDPAQTDLNLTALKPLLKRSYELVAAKLPKKTRVQLGI